MIAMMSIHFCRSVYFAIMCAMYVIDEIRRKRDAIYAIARAHKAEKLWVFGSCARGEETPESDVDFLVRYVPGVTYMNQSALNSDLAQLLGRPVDVVSVTSLRRSPWFANEVVRDLEAV